MEALERKDDSLEAYRVRTLKTEGELQQVKKEMLEMLELHSSDSHKLAEISEQHSELKAEYAEMQTKLHALQTATTMQDLHDAEEALEDSRRENEMLYEEQRTLQERLAQVLSEQQQQHRRMGHQRRTSTFRKSLAGPFGLEISNPVDQSKRGTAAEVGTGSHIPHLTRGDSQLSSSEKLAALAADNAARAMQEQTLVNALRDQTRDLEQQLESVTNLQHALSTANAHMSDQSNATAGHLREVNSRLGLSEDLLLPAIQELQRLQRSKADQSERIDSLLADLTRERRRRSALAKLSLCAYTNLKNFADGHVDTPVHEVQRVLHAMNAHAPSSTQSTSMFEQLELLSLCDDHSPATHNVCSPSVIAQHSKECMPTSAGVAKACSGRRSAGLAQPVTPLQSCAPEEKIDAVQSGLGGLAHSASVPTLHSAATYLVMRLPPRAARSAYL